MKHNIPFEYLDKIPCTFDPTFDYQQAAPYVFHKINTIEGFKFMKEHQELVEYAEKFDFNTYDLIASFGCKVKRVYYTNYEFKGKLVPEFVIGKDYQDGELYLYRMPKNNSIADSLDFPFRNPFEVK